MNIKLIATDLDGTLTQSTNTVGQPEIDALAEASRRGIYVVIATGRTWGALSSVSEQLYKNDYAVISNGASIYDIENQEYDVVSEVSYEKWTSLYKVLAEKGSSFEVYHRGMSYVDRAHLPDFKGFKVTPKMAEEFLASLNLHDNLPEYLKGKAAEKVHVMTTPPEHYDALFDMLKNDPELTVSCSFPGNIEVNAAGSGKSKALEQLIKSLGIKKEEVMVFGDADNDLDMLEWADNSFAMGNATEAAKKAAKYHTLPNTENGVAHAIRKYVLK